MGKRILFCASTASHIRNFHLPYIKALCDEGYEVFTAAADSESFADTAGSFLLPIEKHFFSLKNVMAIFWVRRLLLRERFDALSLHTTLASAVVRAALLTIPKRLRPRVYCICHGYLFGENDGLMALRYLIPEKLCARVTDVLMVMNREDERIARRHRLFREKLVYINGMGVSPKRFFMPEPSAHLAMKRALGFENDDFLFACVAELSKRKNQQEMIRAFALALPKMPRAYLLLAGEGALRGEYSRLIDELGVSGRVRLLGQIADIPALLGGCDACVSSSLIEGMPFSIMEALSCGLPVIASDIKGHRELAHTSPAFRLFSSQGELKAEMTRACRHINRRYEAKLSEYLLPNVLPEIMAVYLESAAFEKTKETTRSGVA